MFFSIPCEHKKIIDGVENNLYSKRDVFDWEYNILNTYNNTKDAPPKKLSYSKGKYYQNLYGSSVFNTNPNNDNSSNNAYNPNIGKGYKKIFGKKYNINDKKDNDIFNIKNTPSNIEKPKIVRRSNKNVESTNECEPTKALSITKKLRNLESKEDHIPRNRTITKDRNIQSEEEQQTRYRTMSTKDRNIESKEEQEIRYRTITTKDRNIESKFDNAPRSLRNRNEMSKGNPFYIEYKCPTEHKQIYLY